MDNYPRETARKAPASNQRNSIPGSLVRDALPFVLQHLSAAGATERRGSIHLFGLGGRGIRRETQKASLSPFTCPAKAWGEVTFGGFSPVFPQGRAAASSLLPPEVTSSAFAQIQIAFFGEDCRQRSAPILGVSTGAGGCKAFWIATAEVHRVHPNQRFAASTRRFGLRIQMNVRLIFGGHDCDQVLGRPVELEALQFFGPRVEVFGQADQSFGFAGGERICCEAEIAAIDGAQVAVFRGVLLDKVDCGSIEPSIGQAGGRRTELKIAVNVHGLTVQGRAENDLNAWLAGRSL